MSRLPGTGLVRVLLVLCVVLGVTGARAADAPSAASFAEALDAHRARGAAHYEAGRFQEAIDEFRKAYEIGAESVFLFEIAQAYRKLQLDERARFFYRRYLSADPSGPFAEEASRHVEALGPEPTAAVTGVPPSPAVDPSLSALSLSATTPPVRESRTVWQRWWFWAGVGAVVLTGVGIGVLAASGGGTQVPKTDLGHARYF